MKTYLILLSSLILLSCSSAIDDNVKSDFKKNHPNSIIINMVRTEGDFDNLYFDIEFKTEGLNEKECISFLYQKNINDNWELKKEIDCGVTSK